tara:strand:- start:901 stop:1497 length:597 start_codon:yes stop_codon:yes gene_type:complete
MLVKKITKVIITFTIFLFFAQNSNAQTPKDFVTEITSSASKILIKNLDKNTKIQQLRNLAEKAVDIKGVGRYSLGKHRKNITEEQLTEYEKLFKEYFLKSFSSRLSEYTDPKINVIGQEILNEKYTMVSSILVADEKRPEVNIKWRVYTKNPTKPLIRDVIIEGLSLARTQREEFNSVIQSNDGNIEALFDNLRKFIK